MHRRFLKLPIALVFVLVLMMYIVDVMEIGIKISFSNQGYMSVAIFLFGLGIIAVGGYSFRKVNTTVDPGDPGKTTYLVTAGIYRISRNPMYISFLLWLLACAIYIGNAINLLFLPVFVVLVNRLFIRSEEEVLDKLFGETYRQYKCKVRRWI